MHFHQENHRIQVYDKNSGAWLRTFGVTGEPGADQNHFYCPCSVHVELGPAGLVWVVDKDNSRVVALTKSGAFVRLIGTTGQQGQDNQHFDNPNSVAVAPGPDGHVFVSDGGNHRVQCFTKAGTYVRTIGAGFGSKNDQFKSPAGIAVDGERLLVADYGNHRVQCLTLAGAHVRTLGVSGVYGGGNQLYSPQGVAVEPGAGRVWVADTARKSFCEHLCNSSESAERSAALYSSTAWNLIPARMLRDSQRQDNHRIVAFSGGGS